jgi:hypothetical protein
VNDERPPLLVNLDATLGIDDPLRGDDVVQERDEHFGQLQARLVGCTARGLSTAPAPAECSRAHTGAQLGDPHAEGRAQELARSRGVDGETERRWIEQEVILSGRRASSGSRFPQREDEVVDRGGAAAVHHRDRGQPTNEPAERVLLTLTGRRLTVLALARVQPELQLEVVGEPGRGEHVLFGAARLAGNRRRIDGTLAIAEHDGGGDPILGRRRQALGDLALMLANPIGQVRALRRAHPNQLAARAERRPRRHRHPRPPRIGIDGHAEARDRSIAEQVAREPLIAAAQVRELLNEVVHAENHPQGVVDVLRGIRHAGVRP